MRLPWCVLPFALVLACSGSSGGDRSDAGTGPGAGQVPGATTTVPVSVPASMRGAPFDVPRSLVVPAGFSIAVHARVPGARFMTVTPEGALLVSNPGGGKVSLVRPGSAGADPVVSDWVTGLQKPHDLVFHQIGDTLWLYVSESSGVRRYPWSGAPTAPAGEVVVSGLPDNSTPELRGTYGHELKNIALDSQHRLFVAIASTCNVCASDAQADPVRGSVYVYDATGGNGRLYARGLRNAEGLAFFPGSDDLWVAVNNRDEIPYPLQDATSQYGQIVPSYVDNHPPDELIKVRDGGNYGWPYCNPNPDTSSGMFDMPFDRDFDTNRDGTAADCSQMDRVTMGIQAHSAALGLLFLQQTRFPGALELGRSHRAAWLVEPHHPDRGQDHPGPVHRHRAAAVGGGRPGHRLDRVGRKVLGPPGGRGGRCERGDVHLRRRERNRLPAEPLSAQAFSARPRSARCPRRGARSGDPRRRRSRHRPAWRSTGRRQGARPAGAHATRPPRRPTS